MACTNWCSAVVAQAAVLAVSTSAAAAAAAAQLPARTAEALAATAVQVPPCCRSRPAARLPCLAGPVDACVERVAACCPPLWLLSKLRAPATGQLPPCCSVHQPARLPLLAGPVSAYAQGIAARQSMLLSLHLPGCAPWQLCCWPPPSFCAFCCALWSCCCASGCCVWGPALSPPLAQRLVCWAARQLPHAPKRLLPEPWHVPLPCPVPYWQPQASSRTRQRAVAARAAPAATAAGAATVAAMVAVAVAVAAAAVVVMTQPRCQARRMALAQEQLHPATKLQKVQRQSTDTVSQQQWLRCHCQLAALHRWRVREWRLAQGQQGRQRLRGRC